MANSLEVVKDKTLFKVVWSGKPGPVPKELQTKFVSERLAKEAISLFHQGRDNKVKSTQKNSKVKPQKS